jgi:hypothetical protein
MSLAGLPLAPIGGPLRAWLDSAVASEKLSPTSKVDAYIVARHVSSRGRLPGAPDLPEERVSSLLQADPLPTAIKTR